MEHLRMTMRNRTVRKDAAYVVTIEDATDQQRDTFQRTRRPLGDGDPLYTVTGHWGPWRSYEQDHRGLTSLRNQVKYTGVDYRLCEGVAYDLRRSKERKGYSQLGRTANTPPRARTPQPSPPTRPVINQRDLIQTSSVRGSAPVSNADLNRLYHAIMDSDAKDAVPDESASTTTETPSPSEPMGIHDVSKAQRIDL